MADALSRANSLAGVMEEAGAGCTASETSFREVLKHLPAPTEHAVAEVLGMIARTSGEGSKAWDVNTMVDGLKSANPALDWLRVVEHLDTPEFEVPDAASLLVLMSIWRSVSGEPFPLHAFVGGLWTNATGQLSFLKQATIAPPEVLSWASAEHRQEPLDGLHAGKSPTGTPNKCWMCLDLYSTLAALADSGHSAAVRHILEHPLKGCPEILLLGVASVKGGWGPLQEEVCDALVATYVTSHPNSSVVLPRVWQLNNEVVVRAMVALYQKDATTVSRALDVCQELKELKSVLESTPAPFCFELAALAARREFLNLEKWLGEQFTARGVPFMQAAVNFLDYKLREDSLTISPTVPVTPTSGNNRIQISVDTLATFLRALANNAGDVPTDTLQQLKLVQAAAVQAHPELAAVVADAAGMEAFPQDVEEEANNNFQRMYSSELSVEAVVELLRNHKNSTLGREQEVFACMVHNLFDEFRFFAKYPEKELQTTAVLFGQLVHHGLVSSVSLGIALRYVLDALRTEVGDKLFRFGVLAARQFLEDLSQWGQYATQMAGIPGLKEAEPELFAAVEAAVAKAAAASTAAAEQAKSAEAAAAAASPASNGAPAPVAAAAAAASAVTAATRASLNAAGFPTSMPAAPTNPNMLFSTINAETLEQAAQSVSYPVPDEKTIDRVHFVINNITVMNVEAKVKELKELVNTSFQPWFVNYLVVKRAAQEPNFHPVYVAIVDKWNDRLLRQQFTRITVHYCKVMLASKLLRTNSSERTLLKNLGAFLGKLTLARNRPVLQRDLDVKAIIIDAYEQGKLLAVLSFVRNFLEPCNGSKVFRPPNPWVMGVLSLLAEIYALEGLKTSLKFEVELLFKQLEMQVQDVSPSALLLSRVRETADNMDFQPTRPATGAGRPGEAGTSLDGKPGTGPASSGPMLDPNILASLRNFIVINPQLNIVGERLQLKRLVPMAVDRAVVEIISPVVERSVTIACMTAHELVSKDFALEPEADAVRRAAHLAVTGLAQSLALVTAREPLRLAVSNNLRALLANQLDPSALEQVVLMLVGDNLDLCCQVVERAAGERAQREIDERLTGAYSSRTRAKAAGQRFADAAQLQGRFPSALPDALRAKPGTLTPQQQRVYQDFAHIPRTAAAAQQASGQRSGAAGAAEGAGGEGGAMDGATTTTTAGVAVGGPPQGTDLRSRFINWLQRVDGAVAKEPAASLASLPDGHELKTLVSEIASLPTTEQTAVEVAKNLFAKLYQGPMGRLHATTYVATLAVLRDAALRRLPMELTSWFGQLSEELRFQKEAGEVLIRGGLFSLPDLDMQLTKALTSPRYQPAAEFLLAILQSCIMGPEPSGLSTSDLPNSVDILSKLAARVSGGHAVLQLVEEARRVSLVRGGAAATAGGVGVGATPVAPGDSPRDPPQLVDAVMKLFDRWARLLEEKPTERVHREFVVELQAAGVLQDEESTERFIRIMVQLAVQHCLRLEAAAVARTPAGAPRPTALSFVAVDAFVRLMVCLISQHGGGPPLAIKVMGVMATALQRDADQRGGAFNGRPYFRMVVGLLSELAPSDPSDEAGTSYLQSVAGFLHATRPLRVPGFSFAWLQLVADRRFMPRLLSANGQVGWGPYLQLLLAQLRFLEPFLRNAELTDAVRLLYKGTLRLLLVLLHDFPGFLCTFHFPLCDAMPPSCIQMRNLVLSAFPPNMRLPDPFTPNLKVDMLPEIAKPPRFSPTLEALLPPQLRTAVDTLLAGRAPAGTLPSLRSRLMLSPAESLVSGTRYNVPLLNALVFYAGARTVEEANLQPGSQPPMKTPAMELYLHLLREMDGEGRYLLINSVANHLRYPNSHTHYFSCVVLELFVESGNEGVQEQITRVLLERLIVNRPHPWGLLITFIELIKNARYKFWSHGFTKVAPEIERLFDSVARSCLTAPGAKEEPRGPQMQLAQ